MATTTESPTASDVASRIFRAFLALLRSFASWARKLMAPPVAEEDLPELTFYARIRKFLWLSSGLFSAASFTIPAIGFLAFGSAEGAATNFLAAVVSACLFGFASLLHFGPDTA